MIVLRRFNPLPCSSKRVHASMNIRKGYVYTNVGRVGLGLGMNMSVACHRAWSSWCYGLSSVDTSYTKLL